MSGAHSILKTAIPVTSDLTFALARASPEGPARGNLCGRNRAQNAVPAIVPETNLHLCVTSFTRCKAWSRTIQLGYHGRPLSCIDNFVA